jgi:steroid 5-alpha reductase family enzyme
MLAGVALSAGVIGGVNALGFAITLAAPSQAEKITDLFGTGSIAASALVTYAYAPAPPGLRAMLVTAAVVVWGVRLAGFLFYRVLTTKGDTRLSAYFETTKSTAAFWAVSALWGWLMALPQTLLCFSPAAATPLGPIGVAAAALFCAAAGCEAVADWQKLNFKTDPANKGRWCDVGLWKECRHPNYASELTVWASVFVLVARGLVQTDGGLLARYGGVAAAALCPLFVSLIILKVSGVPIAEARGDERYGHLEAYQRYKRETPLLVPRFLRASTDTAQ